MQCSSKFYERFTFCANINVSFKAEYLKCTDAKSVSSPLSVYLKKFYLPKYCTKLFVNKFDQI